MKKNLPAQGELPFFKTLQLWFAASCAAFVILSHVAKSRSETLKIHELTNMVVEISHAIDTIIESVVHTVRKFTV